LQGNYRATPSPVFCFVIGSIPSVFASLCHGQVFCQQYTIEHETFHPNRRRRPNIVESLRYNIKRGGLSVAPAGLKEMTQTDKADGSPLARLAPVSRRRQ
jgi:hypothetical protein